MDSDAFRVRNLDRSPLFAAIADTMMDRIPGIQTWTYFRPESPLVLAQTYFLLSDAYKAKRRQQTRTDNFKIAAMSALAVMVIRPFEPIDVENVTKSVGVFANSIFALACANAFVSDRYILSTYSFDYLRRFYIALDAVRLPCLTDFIAAANNNDNLSDFTTIDLSWDEAKLIEAWIEKIWHLSARKI